MIIISRNLYLVGWKWTLLSTEVLKKIVWQEFEQTWYTPPLEDNLAYVEILRGNEYQSTEIDFVLAKSLSLEWRVAADEAYKN